VSVRGLLWAVWLASGTVCAAACAVQSVRVRWGHLGGIGPEARVGVVSPVSSDQNKKGTFFAKTHPTFTKRNPSDCASLQKFPAKTKRPLQRVCVLCYTCLTSLEMEESTMNQKNDKNKERREKNEKISASIWGIIIGAAFLVFGVYLMAHGISNVI
jgi:hypothetical protein